MAIHGDLKTFPLADLLSWLRSSSRSGVLSVSRDGGEWQLSLGKGRVVGYGGPELGEDLGQIAVLSGLITEADLRVAIRHGKENDISLQRAFTDLSIIAAGQLHECLTELATESLYDLFLDLPGTFVFSDASERGIVLELEDEELLPLDVDINHLLMEGARRQDEWVHIRERFPRDDVRVRIIDERLPPLEALAVRERRILASLAAGQSVTAICLELRAPVPSVLRILAQLEAIGAVQIIGHGEGEPVERDRFDDLLLQAKTLRDAYQYDEAVALLEVAVRMRPSDEKARDQLEEALEEQISDLYIALPPLKIPHVVDEARLRKMSLRPEERFVVDRLAAHMDVGGLIMVSALNERDTLKMLRKLVHGGIVELR